MKEMGLDAYRFSISWPRILPKGKLKGGINKEGVRYFNNLINELLAHGIQPFVTLLHNDLPQTLEEEYGGFLSPRVVDDFRDYVDVCFKEFGDRVKHWITLNEPWSLCYFGYTIGTEAPGRCSAWQMLNCTGGDSGTEPYIVAHHQILAHAAAVKLYKEKYQASQKGIIGITLIAGWFLPYSNAKPDRNAALRALDFSLGWFMEPITYGDYPHSMRALVGGRLPTFTKEQSLIVKGSFDFLGLNYYTSDYAKHVPPPNTPPSYLTDRCVNQTRIGSLLLYIKQKYNNPFIYITENGVDEFNNSTLPLEQQLSDYTRIDYHYRHLLYLKEAIKDGVRVKGYFAWSLLDNFEWASGYTV
ncbi:hypothetical protein BT93_I0056 [Corymbia citriodora subsp. variegata]|nr:hypothetical protein BT93_I0056 [Corymbia citriodora subsp. variegata]